MRINNRSYSFDCLATLLNNHYVQSFSERETMKPKNRELVDMLQEQISVEERIIKSSDNAINICESIAVKCILYGTKFESSMHIEICRAVIAILSGKDKPHVETENVKEVLNEHMKLEEKALVNAKIMVDKAPSRKIRMLLKKLASDEERHNSWMKKICAITAPMNETEIWNILLWLKYGE